MTGQILLSLAAGALGGLFALLGNLFVQRYVSHLELKNEVAKRKIRALDEAWSAVERSKVTTHAAVERAKAAGQTLSSWETIVNAKIGGSDLSVRDAADHAMSTIEANRLWLDGGDYNSLLSYHNTVAKFVFALVANDQSYDFGSAQDELDRARNDGIRSLNRHIWWSGHPWAKDSGGIAGRTSPMNKDRRPSGRTS